MSDDTPDDAQDAPADADADAYVAEGVGHDAVETDVRVTEGDDGTIQVTRSAAFAEVATRPTRVAIDDEHTSNEVVFYDSLATLDAELAGTIRAQSQLASMGASITHPASEGDDEEMSDLEQRITEACERLVGRELGLLDQLDDIYAHLIVHGNDVVHLTYEEGDLEAGTGGVTDLAPLPLRALTILDDETHDGASVVERLLSVGNDKPVDPARTIDSADWYVLNEGKDTEQAFPARDVLHIAPNADRNWHTDLKGRSTYGIYGQRRLEPVKWALQAKQNTLANKVAMDDKLLAREFFQIDVDTLFGHIHDDEERTEKAKAYAKDLKEQLENLDADEKMVIPQEVEVEVKGPDGETAQKMADFIEMMNNAIQHALTFHVTGFGRDAGGTERGNRPAKELSLNNIRHLRETVADAIRRLFEMHVLLTEPQARQPAADPDAEPGTIEQWDLADDVVLPEVVFDPLDPPDPSEEIENARTLYEGGVASLNEARERVDLDPLDPDEVDDMMWFPGTTGPKDPQTKQERKEEEQRRQEQQQLQQQQGPGGGGGGGQGDGGQGDGGQGGGGSDE